MELFATLDELKRRLDWELSDAESLMAEDALSDASVLVRHYGNSNWTTSSCPAIAKTITLTAAKRYMANSDGYVQSRAGDETVAWSDVGAEAQGVFLTAIEQKQLKAAAGAARLVGVQVTAYGPVRHGEHNLGYVPASDEVPFPYFNDEGPW